MADEKQTSSGRPRFYELGHDPLANAIYKFTNKERVFPTGDRRKKHRVHLPETRFSYLVGVPEFAERPSFVLGSRKKNRIPLDYYDAAGFMLISSRFKALIDDVDPGAIEAVECDARNPKGEPLPPYWWIDVIRVLDSVVDEEKSVLRFLTESPFASGDDIEKLLYLDLQDISFRQSIVSPANLFRILRYTARPIVGERLADVIREAGTSGLFLTPLQPPLPEEAKYHLSFCNYPYWTNEAYGALSAPSSTSETESTVQHPANFS